MKPLNISQRHDYVKVMFNGSGDISEFYRICRTTVEKCRFTGIRKVLSVSTSPLELKLLDAYEIAEVFTDLNVNYQYRIAWLDNFKVAEEKIQFIVTVLKNRGVRIKQFANETDARNWLQESSFMNSSKAIRKDV